MPQMISILWIFACGEGQPDDELGPLLDRLAQAEERLEALEAAESADLLKRVGALEDEIARLQFDAEVADNRIAELEAATEGLEELLAVVRVEDESLIVEGVNLHLRSGAGRTDSANGLGNLIIGYAADDIGNDQRTGSHNLVIGDEHDWTGWAGIVSGWGSRIGGAGGSVVGGYANVAEADYSAVAGGLGNEASGRYAAVLGGQSNTASGQASSVSGGGLNVASGEASSVAGGTSSEAAGSWAAVSGGRTGRAEGGASVVVGGQGNLASGTDAVLVGGRDNALSGDRSVLLGGAETSVEEDEVVGP